MTDIARKPNIDNAARAALLFLIAALAACGGASNEDESGLSERGEARAEEDSQPAPESTSAMTNPIADFVPNDYPGTYHLKNLFRGAQECLDANYNDPDMVHGGAHMAACDGSESQKWQLTAVMPHHYQIWAMKDGVKVCLDGNDRESFMHGGSAFAEPCRGIPGQIWTFGAGSNGAVELHSELMEQTACLEGNDAQSSSAHAGAAFMDRCTGASGQQWTLEAAG